MESSNSGSSPNKNKYCDHRVSLPATLHFNQEIARYSKLKQYDQAQHSFERMLHSNIHPDVVTYNTMINVFVKSQRLSEALNLFDQMKKENIEPTIVTYTSLIDGCGKNNNFGRALTLYQSVKPLGIQLNMHFFNAILNATFLKGNLQTVDSILEDIKKSGLKPNTVTYNTMLAGYIRFGLLDRMKPIIKEMIASKVQFSPITQTTILQSVQLIKDNNSLLLFMELLSTAKFIPSKIQSTQSILDILKKGRLLIAQQLLAYLINFGSQVGEEAFIEMLLLAGKLANFQTIHWTKETARGLGYNLSYHAYIAQMCGLAGFMNYEQTIVMFDQLYGFKPSTKYAQKSEEMPSEKVDEKSSKESSEIVCESGSQIKNESVDRSSSSLISHLPFFVCMKLIQCFLAQDDTERSEKVIGEFLSTARQVDENDSDKLLQMHFERSLFERVLRIFEMFQEKGIRFGPKGSGYVIQSAVKLHRMNFVKSVIGELSLSVRTLIELASESQPDFVSSVQWERLVDGITAVPSASSIEELIKVVEEKKLPHLVWPAFKHFVVIGAEVNDSILNSVLKNFLSTSYQSSSNKGQQNTSMKCEVKKDQNTHTNSAINGDDSSNSNQQSSTGMKCEMKKCISNNPNTTANNDNNNNNNDDVVVVHQSKNMKCEMKNGITNHPNSSANNDNINKDDHSNDQPNNKNLNVNSNSTVNDDSNGQLKISEMCSKSEADCVFLLNILRENGISIPSQLYSMSILAAISNGDLATALDLKFEAEQVGVEIDSAAARIFSERYESIKSVLPSEPPKIPRKQTQRRRSRTYPQRGPVTIADEMQELSTRSAMIALDLDFI